MGLPMFREPEDEPVDRVVARVDKAAATSRSAIRRESTVRPGRYNAISSPRSRHAPRSQVLEHYHTRLAPINSVAHSDEAELEAEIERLRRRRETRSRIRWGSTNENEGNDSDRRQAGEELLRDALQHERPDQRLRLLRPPRESALRFEVAPSPPLSDSASPTTSSLERAFMRPYIPSPPYSLNVNDPRTLPPDGPLPPTTSVELTPGFAPAQGAYRETDHTVDEVVNPTVDTAMNARQDSPWVETPPPETWEASYPALRRVGHLSPPLSQHDGLGDRQRSPGSAWQDSNAEEDTWETLLTTMEEDDNQPSAESSFTSAIASASTSRRSDSASRSGRSSQTSATSLGELELVDAGQPCESDDEQDDTSNLHDPSAASMIRGARRRYRHLPLEPPSFQESQVFENVHVGAVRAAERRASTAEAALRRMESQAAAAEAGIAQMQSFIDRLAGREDIPSEIWTAVAGLSRIIREGQ